MILWTKLNFVYIKPYSAIHTLTCTNVRKFMQLVCEQNINHIFNWFSINNFLKSYINRGGNRTGNRSFSHERKDYYILARFPA